MTNQILAESTFACEDLCRHSPDCVWFTHYLDKGTVFLRAVLEITMHTACIYLVLNTLETRAYPDKPFQLKMVSYLKIK